MRISCNVPENCDADEKKKTTLPENDLESFYI